MTEGKDSSEDKSESKNSEESSQVSPQDSNDEVATALNLSRVDVEFDQVKIETGREKKAAKEKEEADRKKKEKALTDTSSNLAKVEMKALKIESGQTDSDEGENKKVAKTMMESDLPSLGAIKDKIEDEKDSGKVAKTMIEMDKPKVDEIKNKIESESLEPEPASTDSVAKTLLESQMPSKEELLEKVESKSDNKEEPRDSVAKTMLETDLPDSEALKDAIEKAAKGEGDSNSKEDVARTMLESDFPDLLRIHSLIENKESELARKKEAQLENKENEVPIEDTPGTSSEEQWKEKSQVSGPGKMSRLQEVMSHGALNVIPELSKKTVTLLNQGLHRSLSDLETPEEHSQLEGEEPVSISDSATVEISTPPVDKPEETSEEEPQVDERPDSELSPTELFQKQLAEMGTKPAEKEEYVKPDRREEFVARTMLDHELILENLSDSLARMEQKAKKELEEKELEPPVEKEYITDFKIAKECPWSWSEEDNGDRFRYCGKCDNLIYDFHEVEKFQADSIIFQRENIEKYTLYKRHDEKFMTSDCPLAMKSHKNKTLIIVAAGGLLLLVLLSLFSPKPAPAPKQTEASSETKLEPSAGTATPETTTSASAPTPTSVSDSKNTSGKTKRGKGKLVPKIKKGSDGSYYYDIDDPSTYSFKGSDSGVNPQPKKEKEKDYSNVPESDEAGGFWRYDGK